MSPADDLAQFELPQFPLESVVLPSQVLSLHIFEPRYRQLVEDLLAGDGRFGVILITRGSEVGGDDQRAKIGTLAELQEAAKLDDGRWLITAAGIERYNIVRWLEDDPYPRAQSQRINERLLADEPHDDQLDERYQALTREFSRAMAMLAELGGPGSLDELSVNRDVAIFQMSTLLPVGPLDKYKILDAGSSLERLSTLEELISETTDLLRFQLSEG